MEQLLDPLFHTVDQDLPGRVMSKLPAVYNDCLGSEIPRVVQTRDGSHLDRGAHNGSEMTRRRAPS
jgi:hypothetical protein